MSAWPFSQSRAAKDAEKLLVQVTMASRNPALFGEGRVADTLDGRFELMTLHAALALARLRREPAAKLLAQAFVDALFRQFDSGLREDGVGDLAVPKRAHRLAGGFYGRASAYEAALSNEGGALAAALTRNALGGQPGFSVRLGAYARATAAAQSALPWTALLTRDAWPAFAA